MTYLLFFILTLLAEIVGTVGGFGSSVFFVPIAGFFFEFDIVLGMTAVFHVGSNLAKMILFRKGLDKFVLLHIGIPAVVFVIIGAYLTSYLDSTYFEILLGFFLVIFSSFLLLKPFWSLNATQKNAWTGGAISGFVAGLLGTGGAIRGLTMAAFNIEKSIFISTSAAIDMGVDVSRAVIYAGSGYINKNTLLLIPSLLIISFVGSFIGKFLLNYLPQEKFKKILLFLILGIGLVTLISSFL